MPANPVAPFLRVYTRYNADGGITVKWHLDPLFDDPLPYIFTLEGNFAGVATSDGWQTVSLPETDVWQLSEHGDHHLGMYQDYDYRVRLSTPESVYYSRVVSRPDPAEFREWRIARDIVRKERLRHQLYTSLRGWLFRRRRGGFRCPRCVEAADTGPTDDRCVRCYGTGYDGGYFAPVYCDMQLEVNAIEGQVDPSKERGTVEDRVISGARMLGDPYPFAMDSFVDGRTNLRYFVHKVQEAAIIRSYPTITLCEVRVANQNDVVYNLSIPQLPAVARDELNPDTL